MSIVLLSRDLMLLSRCEGAANNLSIPLSNVSDAAQASLIVAANDCRGIVIDLRTPGLQLSELVAALRSVSDKLVIAACGPHVHEASLNAARDAGCDVVVTRGQFERDAELIFSSCLNTESA